MTISIIDAINDPTVRTAFRRGEILGAECLSADFVAGRLGRDADEIGAELDAAIADQVQTLDAADIHALARLIDEASEALLRAPDPDWQAAVVTADSMVQEDATTLASGSEKPSSVLRAAALTLLLSAQAHGDFDFTTGVGKVSFSIGAPPRVQELIETVIGGLSKPPASKPPVSKPPAHKAEAELPLAPKAAQIDPDPALPAGPEPVAAVASDETLSAPVGYPPPALLMGPQAQVGSLEYCEAALSRVAEAWSSGLILDKLGGESQARALFQTETVEANIPVDDGVGTLPFALGFSIVATPTDPTTGANVSYRPAIRVQSVSKPKAGAFQRLRDLMDEITLANPQTRWTSPVIACPSNPAGESPRWKSPSELDLPPTVGACIAAAGGCAGALGLFVRRDNEIFAVTAGHVAADDGHNLDNLTTPPLSRAFYHPLQPWPPSNGAERMGVVEYCEVFPKGSLASGVPPIGEARDFCLLWVEPGFVPKTDRRRRMGRRQFANDWWRDEALAGLRVIKSPARTSEAQGRIVSDRARLPVFNTLRKRIEDAGPLIEIELDETPGATFGDSGSLVCVESNGQTTPLGILVARATTALMSGDTRKARPLIYVQSFLSIFARDPRFAGFKVA